MEKKQFWNDLKSGHFASMVRESSRGQRLSSSEQVFNVMKPMFADMDDVERMYCIFLDAQNYIIAIEKMSEGTIAHATVYPREIIKRVIVNKATAAVLVHNHPSSDTSPSKEDHVITGKVFMALSSVDTHLHDHVIIGDSFYSMADEGVIERIREKVRNLTFGI